MAIELYQGADRDIIVSHDDSNLTSAIEIECKIDTPSPITKTLTGGGISGVTATQFTVTIEDTDTSNVPAGGDGANGAHYRIQYRYTAADGTITHGKSSPQEVEVIDSIFTDAD